MAAPRSDSRGFAAVGLLSAGLCGVGLAVALTGTATPAQAVTSVAVTASLLGVGLYAWQRESESRFGAVLFGTGICWFFAALSNSDVALLYSVGRSAAWVFEVVLVYALLSYPTGRLETRAVQRQVAVWAAALVALYLPTIPLSAQFPLPTPFTGCTADCPPNAFFLGTQPALVDAVIRPVREVLTVLLYLAVAAVLGRRLSVASRNVRRTVAPVLVAAIVRFVAAFLFLALRLAGAGQGMLHVASVVVLLSVAATALGLYVGLLRWRLYAGAALAQLTSGAADTSDPAQLHRLLAHALDDPAARLRYRRPGDADWVDAATGASVGASVGAGKGADEGWVDAQADSGLHVRLRLDPGAHEHPEFVGAVTSCVLSRLDRQWLDLVVASSKQDAAESQRRLVRTADGARRQLERDLHDGAQQQLVALRMNLGLARDALARDPEGAADLVARLGSDVDAIIDEVRSLARGIYPPLLRSAGLPDALEAVAQRSALPVTVDAKGVGRFAPETEGAVYFCCLEALQNASKHAVGATAVQIELRCDDALRFEVRDDGAGFVAGTPAAGTGMAGMRDRLAAFGGELSVTTAPGEGTRVVGRVPLPG